MGVGLQMADPLVDEVRRFINHGASENMAALSAYGIACLAMGIAINPTPSRIPPSPCYSVQEQPSPSRGG